MALLDFDLLRRLQPNVGHRGEEFLGRRLVKLADVLVPPGTLEEETVDVAAILGCLVLVMIGLGAEHFKVHLDLIDGNNVLTGVVLFETGQERLGKEETRDPEAWWRTFVDPSLHELETQHKVNDVGSEWPQRWVRTLQPGGGNLVIED